jgi:hypothetical protein
MTMLVHIHHEGRVYDIEAPAGARIVQTSGEDCLVYRWEGRTEYLLTPFAGLCARKGERGLRLVRERREGAG